MRVLQVNTSDRKGGAARIASNLHAAYLRRGIDAEMAVGTKLGDGIGVWEIPDARFRGPVAGRLVDVARWCDDRRGRIAGAGHVGHGLKAIAGPRRALRVWRGHEDFDFPATKSVLHHARKGHGVIHCHNLHGGYFDLTALPALTHAAPVVTTLHDSWLLSGHCSHSPGCERWRTGCGSCPDLTLYPAVRRDATASNWTRKRDLYARARIHLATPSQWLMDKVTSSMLMPAVVEAHVIPNGVDTEIFRPGNRATARQNLALPADAFVIMFVAEDFRLNPWKDFAGLQTALSMIAGRAAHRNIVFLPIGDVAAADSLGDIQTRSVGRVDGAEELAAYYQAADVYVHAAHVDTFPNVVLEALACGTPVIATAVGGISEQVRALGGWARGEHGHDPQTATGLLVPASEPDLLAAAIEHVMADSQLGDMLGNNAAADAGNRFTLARQAETYLEWYAAILDGWRRAA